MPKCSVNVYPMLESSSYTCPAEFVVPPNSTYEVRPVSCAGGLACAKADTARKMAAIKTVKQEIRRLLIFGSHPLSVTLELSSLGKVGNHYCPRRGHAQASPAPLGSFKTHPGLRSRVAQVTEVQPVTHV